MSETESLRPSNEEAEEDHESERGRFYDCILAPFHWLKMLATETHWSYVFAVVVVYGISQGMGGALFRVGTEYYMKDVQKVQPSESQIYQGIIFIPWLVKPLWGLLTDVFPILGYRRRPYFVLSGLVGVFSTLVLALHDKVQLLFAVVLLTTQSMYVAIADVTIDACVAENSNTHPALAADLQSLCSFSSSIGALLGYSLSGVFVHLLGPKGVLGLLAIPAGLVSLVGMTLSESNTQNSVRREVHQNIVDAGKAMWKTLKFPEVWRPCLYIYLSISVSLNIHEGLFYWYTDSKEGPSFSQETIGFISSFAAAGSFLGALLYQNVLKNHPFRDLLFWTQFLFGLTGMLDLVMVLRLNLRLGIPDYFFAVFDASFSHVIGRLKWMPLLVLCSKLCPPGIEGTFFALLMSIENLGHFSSSWLGGLLLHLLHVTRVNFNNLWLTILIRNLLRLTPLCLLCLVPNADQNATLLPTEISGSKEGTETQAIENIELVSLVSKMDEM